MIQHLPHYVNERGLRVDIMPSYITTSKLDALDRERSGSIVECLTRDREAAGSSLTGVTALCP